MKLIGKPTGQPPKHLRCCANCKHWHVKNYIHCMHSGPWGGDLYDDPHCRFERKLHPLSALAGQRREGEG